MAGLKEIKRRLKSVKNTKKITYAMKLVAAAKLQKVQEKVFALQRYQETLAQIFTQTLQSLEGREVELKLLEKRDEIKNIRLIIIGGSRGLCGGFNTNLNKIIKEIKPLKYKEASKYPEIVKDVAFVVPNETSNSEIEAVIKKAGGRLLDNIDIFDIYRDIEPGKKSMAYNLTFKDDTRTLSDEEVMQVFNNIIKEVESKLDAKLRG